MHRLYRQLHNFHLHDSVLDLDISDIDANDSFSMYLSHSKVSVRMLNKRNAFTELSVITVFNLLEL